jgi:hypothetical protein
MWIFTETGFISIVRKPEHPGVLTVRARDRKSLELLAAKAGVEIKRSPNGDYPYRVFVGDGPFLEWFLDRGGELQYDNFKNRVAKTRGYDFAHALSDVWVAMLQVEDEGSRDELTDAELTDRLTEIEKASQPATEDKTKKSEFGEIVPDIDENDPRIVAYLWEAFDEETGDPTWGYIHADEKEDFAVSIPFRVEQLKFFGLLTMPTDLTKNN